MSGFEVGADGRPVDTGPTIDRPAVDDDDDTKADFIADELPDDDFENEPADTYAPDEGEGEKWPGSPSQAEEPEPAGQHGPSMHEVQAAFAQINNALAQDADVHAAFNPQYRAQLAEDDPIELVRAEARGRAKVQQAQAAAQALHQHGSAALSREQAKVRDFAPELIGDGPEAKAARADVKKFLRSEGFSDQEISEIRDARVVRTIMKSYRASKALRETVQSPTIRPNSTSRGATRRERVLTKAGNTRNLHEQADLLAALL